MPRTIVLGLQCIENSLTPVPSVRIHNNYYVIEIRSSDEPPMALPAIADGKLYVRDEKWLLCFQLGD